MANSFYSSSRLYLSNEDIRQAFHLTNIHWRDKYSISLFDNESSPRSITDHRHFCFRSFPSLSSFTTEREFDRQAIEERNDDHRREKHFFSTIRIHSEENFNFFRKVNFEDRQRSFSSESLLCPSEMMMMMSSMEIFPLECVESRRHSLSTSDRPKEMTFEVKTNRFNRNIQIKTKEEDFISRTIKSSLPRQSFENSIQQIRVHVTSTPQQHSKFVPDDLHHEEEQTFDRRPLLDLINQFNQRKKSSPIQSIPNLSEEIRPLTSTRIVPPKQFPSFRPVILHQKTQEPIGRFHFNENSPSIDRTDVLRGQTLSSVNCHSNPSVEETPQPTTTITITKGELPSLDESVLSSRLDKEHHSSVLTNPSNPNGTPTSRTNIDDKNEAKRKAIVMQMYDTEKSYVEALKNLVTKYYLPMKDKAIVSNDLINDIFYKIPEIHIHHTAFLISLSQKLSQWDDKQTVGDLLLQMFTRTSVIETYTSFVNNYKTAQIAIRLCRDFSSFNKFLEQQARDHRGKLTLRDLIIQPVQRIPRYELYIKDFLRCTNLTHPDYQLLLKSQSEIHSLAEQIDHVQKEVGSAELTLTNNSLQVVQEMIENLTDLVDDNRYYIRHDDVTLQSSSGLKKDRCIFLFNDLVIITRCKRRNTNSTKKSSSSLLLNSPMGKQYIDNTKHKLIMKISLEHVELGAEHFKKRKSSMSIPLSSTKSFSGITTDKHRHLEEDILILGQITDLAKTITSPHQQLDESIKETLNTVNKYLLEGTLPMLNTRRLSFDANAIPDNKSNRIHLIMNTTESVETIDVLFSTPEQKTTWEKGFLEAKRNLFEIAAGRRNISFEDVLTLPHSQSGSEFCCGTIRNDSNDLCVCNTEGDLCLINIQSKPEIQTFNPILSSRINCIAYIPSNKHRRTTTPKRIPRKEDLLSKLPIINYPKSSIIDSLLEINSSDDEEEEDEESISIDHSSENRFDDDQQASIWLGTQNGGLFLYECLPTIGRRSEIIKQFNCSIHSILYTDNKVFLALNHGQLCVFRRDINGRWDFDNPIIKSIEDDSLAENPCNGEFDQRENSHPISVISLAAGKLWCAIRDRIFVVCPNSLNVEHSFIVDDCHRHVSSIATGGSSIHHVWIAAQDSHEIRLYHATHFVCLLETTIKTALTQKLQVCDDIIRAHKLGCLHVTSLHVCKETLWIGTSAGVILNLTITQLMDSNSISKLTSNSIQLKGLPFGHAGPIRFIISTEKNFLLTTEESNHGKHFVMTIGDGFEDYINKDDNLGKDDALSHLILWQL